MYGTSVGIYNMGFCIGEQISCYVSTLNNFCHITWPSFLFSLMKRHITSSKPVMRANHPLLIYCQANIYHHVFSLRGIFRQGLGMLAKSMKPTQNGERHSCSFFQNADLKKQLHELQAKITALSEKQVFQDTLQTAEHSRLPYI